MAERTAAASDADAAAAAWTCRHIKLSNPAGPGRPDVPRMLRAMADLLERLDHPEVVDLVLHKEDTAGGPWTVMNLYYQRPEPG